MLYHLEFRFASRFIHCKRFFDQGCQIFAHYCISSMKISEPVPSAAIHAQAITPHHRASPMSWYALDLGLYLLSSILLPSL